MKTTNNFRIDRDCDCAGDAVEQINKAILIDDVFVCVVGSKFECEPTLSLNLASGVVYELLILPRVRYNICFKLLPMYVV